MSEKSSSRREYEHTVEEATQEIRDTIEKIEHDWNVDVLYVKEDGVFIFKQNDFNRGDKLFQPHKDVVSLYINSLKRFIGKGGRIPSEYTEEYYREHGNILSKDEARDSKNETEIDEEYKLLLARADELIGKGKYTIDQRTQGIELKIVLSESDQLKFDQLQAGFFAYAKAHPQEQ
ncbi:MAG: hypothetical protein WCX97_00495 [Candidatus Magasanikbacteria bacterium]